MASIKTATGKFTSGETVNAYLRGDTTLAAAGSGTAAADGSVTITGLASHSDYVLVGATSANRVSVFTAVADDANPGEFAPSYQPSHLLGVSTLSMAANTAYFARFVPRRQFVVDRVHIRVQTADTADNPVDVGIYDGRTLAKIASTGAVTGKLNSTGVKVIDLTAPVTLEEGQIYYVAVAPGTVTTSAVIQAASIANAGFSEIMGTAAGDYLAGSQAAAHPLPATATIGATGTTGLPIVFLREQGT
jgi:hypothetical protein